MLASDKLPRLGRKHLLCNREMEQMEQTCRGTTPTRRLVQDTSWRGDGSQVIVQPSRLEGQAREIAALLEQIPQLVSIGVQQAMAGMKSRVELLEQRFEFIDAKIDGLLGEGPAQHHVERDMQTLVQIPPWEYPQGQYGIASDAEAHGACDVEVVSADMCATTVNEEGVEEEYKLEEVADGKFLDADGYGRPQDAANPITKNAPNEAAAPCNHLDRNAADHDGKSTTDGEPHFVAFGGVVPPEDGMQDVAGTPHVHGQSGGAGKAAEAGIFGVYDPGRWDTYFSSIECAGTPHGHGHGGGAGKDAESNGQSGSDTYISSFKNAGVEACKYYMKNGKCKFGRACKFSHVGPGVHADEDAIDQALRCLEPLRYQLPQADFDGMVAHLLANRQLES